MNENAGTPKIELSLFDVITELEVVSLGLETKIFGERPERPNQPELVSGRISQAIERIKEANSRLREVSNHLEQLGK